MTKIKLVHAREILDSRGNPTVEVDITLEDGSFGRASVASGASTGSLEAFELRDNQEKRFNGKGVLNAVQNVNGIIKEKIIGLDSFEQKSIDNLLINLDGSENKKVLGANAILGVSLAIARASSQSLKIPLYQYLAENILKTKSYTMPVPMFNILNGGAHADNSVDVQEFMIAPIGATSIRQAVQMASETYQSLKSILKKSHLSSSVGDEGGFAPNLKSNVEALELIVRAIENAGYKPKTDIAIALDPATSEFFENGLYIFKKSDNSKLTSEKMIDLYAEWIRDFPILSIEDGLAENDWEGWANLTAKLGSKIQLVGDDIFVTNPKIIKKAIHENIGNASLIKLNQIGTLTETIEAISISKNANYGTVLSHRSGETTDDFIADLAVATSIGQIKTGAPCRGERLAKYNQLMRIEEELGTKTQYARLDPFINCLRKKG